MEKLEYVNDNYHIVIITTHIGDVNIKNNIDTEYPNHYNMGDIYKIPNSKILDILDILNSDDTPEANKFKEILNITHTTIDLSDKKDIYLLVKNLNVININELKEIFAKGEGFESFYKSLETFSPKNTWILEIYINNLIELISKTTLDNAYKNAEIEYNLGFNHKGEAILIPAVSKNSIINESNILKLKK